MNDIVERLKTTGAERQKTTAHDLPDHYLHVVAKISQADGVLMREAAAEIERLRAALQIYANPEIYKPHPHGIAFDRRDLSYGAQAALHPAPIQGEK